MRFVFGNRLTGRRQIFHVDQQVVVTGFLLVDASRGHAHALETKQHGDVLTDCGAVLRRDDVDLGAAGCLGDWQAGSIGGNCDADKSGERES